jgi:hypothetical protein
MQLMAMLKEQDRKLLDFSNQVDLLSAKVKVLEDEAADQAEHIASLIDPLRRRATPGMKAVNGKS